MMVLVLLLVLLVVLDRSYEMLDSLIDQYNQEIKNLPAKEIKYIALNLK